MAYLPVMVSFLACFQDQPPQDQPTDAIAEVIAEEKNKTVKLARPCGSSRTRPRRRPRAAPASPPV